MNEPKDKELEMNCDSLMQSQCSMMMQTVRSSINEPLTVNGIHRDIAQMDAQLANLSMLCNNIQTQYYDINKVESVHSIHFIHPFHAHFAFALW